VVANDKLETAASGVWVAGAVRSGCGGLIDDAVADGKKVAAGVCAKLGR
jgi:thioredoxin reductase